MLASRISTTNLIGSSYLAIAIIAALTAGAMSVGISPITLQLGAAACVATATALATPAWAAAIGENRSGAAVRSGLARLNVGYDVGRVVGSVVVTGLIGRITRLPPLAIISAICGGAGLLVLTSKPQIVIGKLSPGAAKVQSEKAPGFLKIAAMPKLRHGFAWIVGASLTTGALLYLSPTLMLPRGQLKTGLLGLPIAAFSAGSILGLLVLARVTTRLSSLKAVTFCFASLTASAVALSTTKGSIQTLLLYSVAGTFRSWSNVLLFEWLLQQNPTVKPIALAGVQTSLQAVSLSLGGLFFGYLAQCYGARPALAVSGVICAAVFLDAMRFSRARVL